MNEEEWANWETDARLALSGIYKEDEITIVLDWFRSIKGARERELIGDEAVEAMLTFVTARGKFNLYNSLMARIFIYAPLILEENAKIQDGA